MSVFRPGVAIIVVLAASPLHAGTLRGQLTMPAERADSGSDGLWRIDNGILPVVPRTIDPRSECVIVLIPKAEKKDKDKKEETVTVELRGLKLAQTAIAVPVGAQLDLKNEDRVPHTLYTAAPDETVMPMRPTPAGNVRSEKMQRAGIFMLLDDELPHIRGWLVVTDGGITVRPDERGAFSATVPDGRYAMKLFFRGGYVVERDLDIGSKTIELAFTLPVRSARKEAEAPPMKPPAPAPAVAPADMASSPDMAKAPDAAKPPDAAKADMGKK
jgi:hypothetical protein